MFKTRVYKVTERFPFIIFVAGIVFFMVLAVEYPFFDRLGFGYIFTGIMLMIHSKWEKEDDNEKAKKTLGKG